MSRIDIEPDEDGNDFPPPMAADESQEITRPSGHDEHSQIDRNTRKLTPKFFLGLPASLVLAYQSFGVVYGDLSTSPLYVYSSIFAGKLQHHQNPDAIFGAFSLIFWTLTLIPLLKYVIIVLTADDNGEGGTFALYSLLCRHGKFSLLPNQQAADEELSAYKYGPSGQSSSSLSLKRYHEKCKNLRTVLLLVVLLGAGMVIGDGVVTPAMSVISSVSGLQTAHKKLSEGGVRVIACTILVGLFALQHSGTLKFGSLKLLTSLPPSSKSLSEDGSPLCSLSCSCSSCSFGTMGPARNTTSISTIGSSKWVLGIIRVPGIGLL